MSEILGEARVIIRPDTTAFRQQLQTQLAVATKGIVVPVAVTAAGNVAGFAATQQAATGAVLGLASGLEAENAALARGAVLLDANALASEAAGAAAARQAVTVEAAASSTANLASIQALSAKAANDAAAAQLKMATSAGATGAASLRAASAVRVAAIQQEILTAALATGNVELVRAAALTNILARAQAEEALAALAASRGQTAHNASMGASISGARGAALSLVGLRGAMLGASGAFLAGTVAAIALGKSLQSFAELQTQLSVFATTTGATADEMERVSAAARQLGADMTLPAVTAGDAAAAMTELAKAGLSVEDSLGGVRGVLQLSTAAEIGTAEAAQFAANQLNAFGLAGDQAVRVADTLANAANSAQGSIQDFGLAFQQSSAVARQVGLSLEETAAQLVILAQNGLRGSDAGTSLRVALLRLINPTKEAARVIKELGIDLRDAQGNIRPDVFVQFGEATAEFAPAMRDAAFATVFGADAIRTVAIAAREGRDSLVEATAAVSESGTASELAEARTKGLAGQYEALTSSLETTSTTVGRLAGLLAGPLLAATNQVVSGLNRLLDPLNRMLDLSDRLGDRFLGDSFDPANASVAEFLERVQELQRTVESAGGENFAVGLQAAIQDAIAALQIQRTALKAAGQETTALDALIRNLTVDLEHLDPSTSAATTQLEKLADQIRANIEALEEADPARAGLVRLLADIERQIGAAEQDTAVLGRLRDEMGRFEGSAEAAAGGVDALTRALKELGRDAARAQAELLRLQTEGGTPQQQIGVLQGDIQTQRERIATAKRRGGPGTASEITEARNQILADEREIKSIQDDIESIQREQAARAKAAADAAEKARDERDAALLRQFEAITGRVERLLARAGGTDPLKDDIKFTEQLVAIYRKQIEQAAKRITDVETRNRILKTLGDALFAAINDRKRLEQENREKIRDALIERQARIVRGAEIGVELADLNEKNIQGQVNARLKLIAALKKEARVLKLQGLALEENKLARARIRDQINDILNEEKETEKTGKTAQQFFFEQLQAQQGFAANLMGNLIPSDQTAGLVGVPAPDVGRQVRGEAARAEGRAFMGPTAGQGNTEISLLGRILDELKSLNRHSDAPEAKEQRRAGSADMDGSGGAGGGVSAVM